MPKKKTEQNPADEAYGREGEQKFWDADLVKEFADKLIREYHPELMLARIAYVYREKAGNKAGRPVRGTVRKVGGVMQHLTDLDFVVEVAYDLWNPMMGDQREALIDHLLERMTSEENDDGSVTWKVREPDVHEFATILGRRGAWNEDLQTFCGVVQRGVDVPGMVQSVIDAAGDDILIPN